MTHLDVCPHCAAAFSEGALRESGTQGIPGDFISGVLAQTSGPACPEALGLIVQSPVVSQELNRHSAIDPFLTGHLAHCDRCRGFSEAFPKVMHILRQPDFWASDPAFVSDVMTHTQNSMISKLLRRLRQWAYSLNSIVLSRPRIALESAYVATLVLALVLHWSGISISHAAQTLQPESHVIEQLSQQKNTLIQKTLIRCDDTRDAVRNSAEKTWNAILGYGSDTLGWLLKHLEDSNGNEPRNGNNETDG